MSDQAGGDTIVGDVAMMDRDQPSTKTLDRTASGIKRLHGGEVKGNNNADLDIDTAKEADQLLAVIESGAKAAKAAAGSAPSGGDTDAKAIDDQQPTTEVPAEMDTAIPEPKTEAPAAADAAATPADASAAAPYQGSQGAAGQPTTESAAGDIQSEGEKATEAAVEAPPAATVVPAPDTKTPPTTEGGAPDVASEQEFPPLSAAAAAAGTAAAEAAAAEPGQSAADKAAA